MNYLYSATTNSFYAGSLLDEYHNAGTLPDDATPVEDNIYYKYSGEPPVGKVRGAENGLPAWVDIPPPTREELITAAENERHRLLAHADAMMLDWRTELMLGEISDANRAKLSAWMAYKNDVKAVDVTTNPAHVNWPVPPEAQAS